MMQKVRVEVFKDERGWTFREIRESGVVTHALRYEAYVDALAAAVRRANTGERNEGDLYELYYERDGEYMRYLGELGPNP